MCGWLGGGWEVVSIAEKGCHFVSCIIAVCIAMEQDDMHCHTEM